MTETTKTIRRAAARGDGGGREDQDEDSVQRPGYAAMQTRPGRNGIEWDGIRCSDKITNAAINHWMFQVCRRINELLQRARAAVFLPNPGSPHSFLRCLEERIEDQAKLPRAAPQEVGPTAARDLQGLINFVANPTRPCFPFFTHQSYLGREDNSMSLNTQPLTPSEERNNFLE